ncbi:MAG: hypothetical protein KDD19_20700 [Phaeodactylibacter sp.]|nr:hypothetical protein [Phaeodactylibacter sp.]MCB9051780.1 hypothetical protein [Lewinellaceae bacterium]
MYIRSQALITTLLLPALLCAQYGDYGHGARATNVYYENLSSDDIRIYFDLENCSPYDYYYVLVYHEDYAIGRRTYPSDWAVSGARKDSPITCGRGKYVTWHFSRESSDKRNLRAGEFVVEVFTIPQREERFAKRLVKIEEKILRAYSKGRSRKAARLERRYERKQEKYTRKYSYGY